MAGTGSCSKDGWSAGAAVGGCCSQRGINHGTHFDNFDIAGSSALNILGHAVPVTTSVLVVEELLLTNITRSATLEVGYSARGVGSAHARHAATQIGDCGSPHVVRRQVEVEVKHFARVERFDEANLDGLD